MDNRVSRALHQRLIMLQECIEQKGLPDQKANYLIQGNSNATYTVCIGPFPSCTCPDYCYRRNYCKHIYFVLIKILGVPQSINIRSSDFFDILKPYLLARFENQSLIVNKYGQDLQEDKDENFISLDMDHVETHYGIKRKSIIGAHCPICLEVMDESKEQIIYCSKTCGNNMHTVCVERWSNFSGKWACPLCRSDWDNKEEEEEEKE